MSEEYVPRCDRCSSENVYPHDDSKVYWCCKDCGKVGENWDISKEQIERYEARRRERGQKALARFGLISAMVGALERPYLLSKGDQEILGESNEADQER